MTALTILGLMAIGTGLALALLAINPRRPEDDAEDDPIADPAAVRRPAARDAPGRQPVLRLDGRPDGASR